MKNERFRFLGYLETSGGPVCICSTDTLRKWTGAEETSGLYWRAISEIGIEPLEVFLDVFYLFNTETGNFVLFSSSSELIIAEVVFSESSHTILSFDGINFKEDEDSPKIIDLDGLIAIFDSSITMQNELTIECICKMNGADVWNAAFIKGAFSLAKTVYYIDENIHMTGILLTNKPN